MNLATTAPNPTLELLVSDYVGAHGTHVFCTSHNHEDTMLLAVCRGKLTRFHWCTRSGAVLAMSAAMVPLHPRAPTTPTNRPCWACRRSMAWGAGGHHVREENPWGLMLGVRIRHGVAQIRRRVMLSFVQSAAGLLG